MSVSHDKKFLHALLLTGAEYDTIKKIRAGFDSYRTAWQAPASALAGAGLSEERTDAIIKMRERMNPDEEMRKLVHQEIAFITPDDAEYPEKLRTIAAPPFALYIKGSFKNDAPCLAVVGTRKATAYGRGVTQEIIRDLARETDIIIASGLAQGIDAEAHRAALDCGLATYGVIGSGINRESFFPPENWKLAEEMARGRGAIISEYPPGTPALKHRFPARNRIIAGLSAGTLVVEAPEKSGALITANFALEQGRDVFAIPGAMKSPSAAGTHRLIQEGAKLVTGAGDIMEELDLPRRSRAEEARAALTDETEKTILELLGEPASVDDIRAKTRFETPAIVSCLTGLELKGFVRALGQNRFQRIS